jgi:hypothetical protein
MTITPGTDCTVSIQSRHVSTMTIIPAPDCGSVSIQSRHVSITSGIPAPACGSVFVSVLSPRSSIAALRGRLSRLADSLLLTEACREGAGRLLLYPVV